VRGVHAPDRTYVGTARRAPGGGGWEGELDEPFTSPFSQSRYQGANFEETKRQMLDAAGDDPATTRKTWEEARYGPAKPTPEAEP
jgi:hypothetical protein